MKFLFLSWPKFYQVCFELAKKIQRDSCRFNQIVAISRGGLVAARILSDLLNLPISSFTIQAYSTIGQIKKTKITEKLSVNLKGQNILLVDEISDSGRTLKRAITYLKNFQPKKIITAALFYKPGTLIKPDYYFKQVSQWIIFPYEIRETIQQLTHLWQQKGLKLEEIKRRLLKIGFKRKEIELFIKLV